MPRHEYFEELCTLAVAGEISFEEMAEVETHLAECGVCREAFRDYATLVDEHLSAAHPTRVTNVSRSIATKASDLRWAVLRKVANEGLHISMEAFEGSPGSRCSAWFDNLRCSLRLRRPQIATAVFALVLVVGPIVVAWRISDYRHQVATLDDGLRQSLSTAQGLEEQLNRTKQVSGDSDARLREIGGKLNSSEERLAFLNSQHESDLDTIRRLQTRIDQVSAARASSLERESNAENTVTSLRDLLEQARSSASGKESEIVAQQYRINELSGELQTQKKSLDREQQLLSTDRDIRDLMAARNLHIIDIHDQNATGEARPFGRIFLTQGKRLIFYAYDLDTVKVKNASFQAWGQRDDGSKNAINLGIFYIDDKKQSRWTLKVEDPNLLEAVESVFVTVEPSGGTNKPTGKKLMYAYLRNPINHP